MKKTILIILISFLFFQCNSDNTDENPLENENLVKETITFTSLEDDLTVTADTYIKNSNTEFILLCHQAGYSRGEYLDIAPKFAEKGYNCLAIDQRSGNTVNGIDNQTYSEAQLLGLATDYLSARPDIDAAINKAYELNGNKPIFLLGSSYSSSWSLILGKNNPKVKAVIVFSPRENLPGISISNAVDGYEKSVFATSAQSETTTTANVLSNIDAQYLTHFQSTKQGIHGASCLWENTIGSTEYWEALENFLFEN